MAGTAYCNVCINTCECLGNSCLDFAIQCGYKCDSNGKKLQQKIFTKIFLASTSEQNAALVGYFRKLPPSQLSIGMLGRRGFKINLNGPELVPVFDGDFFPKPFEELRKEIPKKICMNGVTENEGILFGRFFRKKYRLEL